MSLPISPMSNAPAQPMQPVQQRRSASMVMPAQPIQPAQTILLQAQPSQPVQITLQVSQPPRQPVQPSIQTVQVVMQPSRPVQPQPMLPPLHGRGRAVPRPPALHLVPPLRVEEEVKVNFQIRPQAPGRAQQIRARVSQPHSSTTVQPFKKAGTG